MSQKSPFTKSSQNTDNSPESKEKVPITAAESTQLRLRVDTAHTGAFAGVEMGVAPDGAAFLSQRGVAQVCGVVPAAITTFAQEFHAGDATPRVLALREYLREQGVTSPVLYTRLPHEGREIHAYTDRVIAAFLTYYATRSAQASRALGLLATRGLRTLVYDALGIEARGPERAQRAIAERAILNDVPEDAFSVFTETLELLTRLARENVDIGPHTVPDISVGQRWAEWWVAKKLDHKYGARRKHPHRYPADYPQAAANDVIEAYVYPLEALGEFRVWLRQHYLKSHLGTYLDGKVSRKQLAPGTALQVRQALTSGRSK